MTTTKHNSMDPIIRSILGAMALAPELIEDSDIKDIDFPPGRFRETFRAMAAMWEKSHPDEIDASLLALDLGGDEATIVFLASMFDATIKLDRDVFCARVAELRKRAAMLRIQSRFESQQKTGEFDFSEIRADIEAYDDLDKPFIPSFDPDTDLMTGTTMQTLDIQVGWTVDKLIPERGLTLIYGPGGVGKTWLALAIGKAVSMGTPFIGLPTKQKPVFYIDRENPWPLLIQRVCKMDIRDVRFWHLSFPIQPPKFDADNWEIYKKLPSGGLMFFDTARSLHDGDENSSQDVGLIMNRLKELRELNNDIVLLHHTPRLNERSVKGSTAWEDLADQVIGFYRVRKGSLKEIKEEIDAAEYDPDALYHLGTGKKTRYTPFKIYVTTNFDTGEFTLADDPGADDIDALVEYIKGPGLCANQKTIIEWAMKEGIASRNRSRICALLHRGATAGRWHARKTLQGPVIYEP